MVLVFWAITLAIKAVVMALVLPGGSMRLTCQTLLGTGHWLHRRETVIDEECQEKANVLICIPRWAFDNHPVASSSIDRRTWIPDKQLVTRFWPLWPTLTLQR